MKTTSTKASAATRKSPHAQSTSTAASTTQSLDEEESTSSESSIVAMICFSSGPPPETNDPKSSQTNISKPTLQASQESGKSSPECDSLAFNHKQVFHDGVQIFMVESTNGFKSMDDMGKAIEFYEVCSEC